MSEIGTPTTPLRVAIVGSGPAAFYAAEALLKSNLTVQVDMFERLPPPYGLVRYGVAPDHPKIKTVTKVYEKIASQPMFRYFGYVEYGKDLTLDQLKEHFHQILFATGAPSDRRMGIPGEDLEGSYPATEFVAWYNGHPDYTDYKFDLSQAAAAVVGVGNVAIDVARILSRTHAELAVTDIADYALEALANSRVKDIYLLGRRGPAQAAFTNPEVKELGELEAADVIVPPEEAQLDPLSQEALTQGKDQLTQRKVEILQGYALHKPTGKDKRLTIRFLVSPVELIGDANGRVTKMRLVRNKLVKSDTGSLSAKATDQFEEIDVGLVFRSVGYRGAPLPGVPFNDRWGVISNEKGRVCDPKSSEPTLGLYTSGWIKRGPSGVIGTNKPDSVETANAMLTDAKEGKTLQPAYPDRESIQKRILEIKPNYFSFADWLKLDQIEISRGQPNRPRDKITSVAAMQEALGRK